MLERYFTRVHFYKLREWLLEGEDFHKSLGIESKPEVDTGLDSEGLYYCSVYNDQKEYVVRFEEKKTGAIILQKPVVNVRFLSRQCKNPLQAFLVLPEVVNRYSFYGKGALEFSTLEDMALYIHVPISLKNLRRDRILKLLEEIKQEQMEVLIPEVKRCIGQIKDLDALEDEFEGEEE